MIARSLAYMSAACLLMAAILPATAHADGAMDAWASFVLAPKVWKGQIVAAPTPVRRPQGGVYLDSMQWPLRVHAPAGTSLRRLTAALTALEVAAETLAQRGWPVPFVDGGAGGSLAFDLYLDPATDLAAHAEIDSSIAFTDFDSAQTYAVVDARLGPTELSACVMSAFAQAALHGQDPSEAPSVLRASGDLAAWLYLGEYGCEDAMRHAQREPERGFMSGVQDSGAAGALFLAMLAERHDAGSGQFVRALWELLRQRSRELVPPGALRASPDFWEALAAALTQSGESLSDDLEEFAAARLFSGEPSARAHASYRVFAALPDGARVPLRGDFAYADLPKRVRSDPDGLRPLGSVYARIRTPAASDEDQLHVWLRAELGPRWSVIAIRRDAQGGEVGRVKAPLRRVPESYLPVQLTADTAEVVIVVTYLPPKTPDADVPPLAPRGFELIVDRVTRGAIPN